jgi:hypothetical protein
MKEEPPPPVPLPFPPLIRPSLPIVTLVACANWCFPALPFKNKKFAKATEMVIIIYEEIGGNESSLFFFLVRKTCIKWFLVYV